MSVCLWTHFRLSAVLLVLGGVINVEVFAVTEQCMLFEACTPHYSTPIRIVLRHIIIMLQFVVCVLHTKCGKQVDEQLLGYLFVFAVLCVRIVRGERDCNCNWKPITPTRVMRGIEKGDRMCRACNVYFLWNMRTEYVRCELVDQVARWQYQFSNESNWRAYFSYCLY